MKPPVNIPQKLQQLEDEERTAEYVALVDSLSREDWEPQMDQSRVPLLRQPGERLPYKVAGLRGGGPRGTLP